LLRIDERPNLIDLNALAGQVAEYAVLIPSGSLACIDPEIEVLCDTAESALGNARHLRGMGHTYVWIEDVDGRLVDEKSLYA